MNRIVECTCDLNPSFQGAPHPAVSAGDLDQRIVNIAGIGPGDRVMCMGAAQTGIEAAISAGNAHLVTEPAGARRLGPFKKRAGVDVVVWRADGFSCDNAARTLACLKRRLRSGGRLVLWFVCHDVGSRRTDAETLRRLLAAAGFASVIAGRLDRLSGDAVVATGVLGAGAI